MDNVIGKRIRQERERLGMSQDALAQAVELANRSQVHKIEAGERRVESMELYRIAQVLGVRMSALFDESRGNVLVLARGSSDEMTQWGLDLLADMEFAETAVAEHGW